MNFVLLAQHCFQSPIGGLRPVSELLQTEVFAQTETRIDFGFQTCSCHCSLKCCNRSKRTTSPNDYFVEQQRLELSDIDNLYLDKIVDGERCDVTITQFSRRRFIHLSLSVEPFEGEKASEKLRRPVAI